MEDVPLLDVTQEAVGCDLKYSFQDEYERENVVHDLQSKNHFLLTSEGYTSK